MNKKFYCNQCKKEVEILEERVDEHGYLFKVLSCEHETAREVNVRDKGIGSDEFRITKVVEDDHVVEEKLKAAEYFLNELKELEKEFGNLASADLSLVLVNLDGFLFEMISALDLFKKINKIKRESKIGKKIKQLLKNKNSWLGRLNNYRNATAHRSILKITTEAVSTVALKCDLERPNQPQSYNDDAYGKSENSSFSPSTNTATLVAVYLAEDPDDSSKGYFNKEIIPYCEEVLEQMNIFLADLKNQL